MSLYFVHLLIGCVIGKIYNILDYGVIPSLSDSTTCINNTLNINNTLALLEIDDVLLIPADNTFWFLGGIQGSNLHNITIKVEGDIYFTNNRSIWPTDSNGHVLECIYFVNISNITITSNNPDKGLIFGNGKKWWGAIDYLIFAENRPRLFHIKNSTNIKIHNIYFKDSPYWTCYLNDVNTVEISHTNISARRTNIDYHDIYDLTAYNTDGFDISGANVHIHDCEIWNDDDCIAVKQQQGTSLQSNCSENMLFENINASGVGLTIGSIGPSSTHSCVRNITFRNIYMYHTWKGIYLKSRPGSPNDTGEITDVLYQNITMDGPTQVPIWIGPQQAIYEGSCKILWPVVPFEKCPVPAEITWTNISLIDVTINDPRESPGVIYGNETNPMKNVIFKNVVVNHPGQRPWGDLYYYCNNTIGYAEGNTKPVPLCFINNTIGY